MRRVTSDLWETAPEQSEGVRSHAYVWAPAGRPAVLFYSPATADQLDELAALGPVSDQYLSHQDEAGPVLQEIRARLGLRLRAPAAELESISAHAPVDVSLRDHAVDDNQVEVVPTPGHSPGSTCFVVTGADGRYLFTGDTLLRGTDDRWFAGCVPGYSDPEQMAASLDLLAVLDSPDLVVSSAFVGDSGVHPVEPGQWRSIVDQARGSLRGAGR